MHKIIIRKSAFSGELELWSSHGEEDIKLMFEGNYNNCMAYLLGYLKDGPLPVEVAQ